MTKRKQNEDPSTKTRIYLVIHRASGAKTMVDTYHPSRAIAAVSAAEYKVVRPSMMEIVQMVQSGIPVLTNKDL